MRPVEDLYRTLTVGWGTSGTYRPDEIRRLIKHDLNIFEKRHPNLVDLVPCGECHHYTPPLPGHECGVCHCAGSFMHSPEPSPDFACIHGSKP